MDVLFSFLFKPGHFFQTGSDFSIWFIFFNLIFTGSVLGSRIITRLELIHIKAKLEWSPAMQAWMVEWPRQGDTSQMVWGSNPERDKKNKKEKKMKVTK